MSSPAFSLASFTPTAGQRLVVIGGCGGMGRTLVQCALELGLRVAVLDIARSMEQHPTPQGVLTIDCNVSDEAAVQAAFAQITDEWGAIDALVNPAGYTGERVRVEDMKTQEWDDIVNTDLRGMFLVARPARRCCAPRPPKATHRPLCWCLPLLVCACRMWATVLTQPQRPA